MHIAILKNETATMFFSKVFLILVHPLQLSILVSSGLLLGLAEDYLQLSRRFPILSLIICKSRKC